MMVENQHQNVPPVVDQKVANAPYSPGMVSYWPQHTQGDEIDLREIWNTVWAGKKIIIVVSLIFALVAIVISLRLPNVYKAEVLLAPATKDDQGSLANIAGQFGGLASLAGISIGGSGVDKATLALEILKSRVFLTEFIRKFELEVPLMAADGWDFQKKRWIINTDAYDPDLGKWIRDVKFPYKPEPSDQELYEVFIKKHITVNQDKKTGMTVVQISSMSPDFAKDWLDKLIFSLNDKMKSRDIQEAQNSIDYLNQQLNKTELTELKQIFYQLIEQQTKTIMLANVRREYVFQIVDPPVVPEIKSSPKRALICLLAVVLGVMVGVILVLFMRRNKKAA